MLGPSRPPSILSEGETWREVLDDDIREFRRVQVISSKSAEQSSWNDFVGSAIKSALELNLPDGLKISFSNWLLTINSMKQWRLYPQLIATMFEEKYLNSKPRFELTDFDIVNHRSAPFGTGQAASSRQMRRSFSGTISISGHEHAVRGRGNGPISALANALTESLGINLVLVDYKEHAIGEAQSIKAATYIECSTGSSLTKWGVGIHEDVVQASLMALLSAASSVSLPHSIRLMDLTLDRI